VLDVELRTPTSEKSSVTKSPEPMREDHGGDHAPHRIAAPVKKKKNRK
jgi:hypothetical protein